MWDVLLTCSQHFTLKLIIGEEKTHRLGFKPQHSSCLYLNFVSAPYALCQLKEEK